jgi:hypothetical protein
MFSVERWSAVDPFTSGFGPTRTSQSVSDGSKTCLGRLLKEVGGAAAIE